MQTDRTAVVCLHAVRGFRFRTPPRDAATAAANEKFGRTAIMALGGRRKPYRRMERKRGRTCSRSLVFGSTVNAAENFRRVRKAVWCMRARCFFPCERFLSELFSATANDRTCCAAAPPPGHNDTYKGDQRQ